jgi:hypothetical protein
MNPNIDKMPLPEMSLPGSTNGVVSSGFESQPIHPEVTTAERGSFSPQAPVMSVPVNPGLPLMATPGQPVSAAPQSINQGSTATSHPTDVHDIEREYVGKAKMIIDQTKTDPYIQSRELSKVKAEFIKKQYGKDIKLSER